MSDQFTGGMRNHNLVFVKFINFKTNKKHIVEMLIVHAKKARIFFSYFFIFWVWFWQGEITITSWDGHRNDVNFHALSKKGQPSYGSLISVQTGAYLCKPSVKFVWSNLPLGGFSQHYIKCPEILCHEFKLYLENDEKKKTIGIFQTHIIDFARCHKKRAITLINHLLTMRVN